MTTKTKILIWVLGLAVMAGGILVWQYGWVKEKLPETKKESISCSDYFDCPEKMRCGDSVCIDVGCLGEGEAIPSTAVSPEGFKERKHTATECCKRLEAIPASDRYDENCNWEPPPPGIVGGRTVCSKCGNGTCEEWESRCNCPEDCR